jgi:PhzF family phenazine biosynthesis protein
MKKIILYQVDAFADEVFKGNPASVCVLEEWLDDALMQNIAMENNQAETVFVVKTDNHYEIRWFSPTVEIALCGHATVATAFILFNVLKKEKDQIIFKSKSGLLYVNLEANGMITIDFPADPPIEVNEIPAGIFEGLNIQPTSVWKGKFDYMVEVENEEIVNNLQPNFKLISTIPSRGVLVTAKGKEVDFVSRCFFPQTGVDEDAVTGSAHCLFVAYWNSKTGKSSFVATQNSKRGGKLICKLKGDRVLMSGHATLYLKGEIYLP